MATRTDKMLKPTTGVVPARALATIYARAIERFEEVEEGGPAITAPDDAKEIKHVRAREHSTR